MQIPLPDGRRLGYAEYGAPGGRPLMLFHGQPGNRLFYPPDSGAEDDMAVRLNARVIVPDRPGYGLSDFQPGRRLLDWPEDIACLADALGLRRFAVAGFSGGGPYAAVCAARLPERITRTGLISTLPPLEGGALRTPLPALLRFNTFLARHFPALFRLTFRLYWPVARRDPLSFVRMAARQAAAPDQAALQQPEVAAMLLRTWQENLRVDSRGYAQDVEILTGAWGFQLSDLPKGVYLWHGELDGNVPLALGQALAQAVPGCKATFLPGKGHFLIFEQWGEILTALLGPLPEPPPARHKHPVVHWYPLGQGRLGLSPRPGKKTFAGLKDAGCTRLVTLLCAREHAPEVGQTAMNLGMEWTWLPLENGTPPSGESAAMFVRGLLRLREQVQAGDSAVLHCAAGIHRTGMAAYTLLRLTGMREDQALAALASMRTVTREGIQPRHIAFGNQIAEQQNQWEQAMNQYSTPFPASYWIMPGKLLAGQYPSSPDPDEAGRKLHALAACGIQRVINLMEEHEVNHLGQPFTRYQEALIELGAQNNRVIECTRYPIRDMSTPAAELLVRILDDIDRALAAGQPVFVHCWGGFGRTGTVIGCYLARHGPANGEVVLEKLSELRRDVRPWRPSPETDEQREMVRTWPAGK